MQRQRRRRQPQPRRGRHGSHHRGPTTDTRQTRRGGGTDARWPRGRWRPRGCYDGERVAGLGDAMGPRWWCHGVPKKEAEGGCGAGSGCAQRRGRAASNTPLGGRTRSEGWPSLTARPPGCSHVLVRWGARGPPHMHTVGGCRRRVAGTTPQPLRPSPTTGASRASRCPPDAPQRSARRSFHTTHTQRHPSFPHAYLFLFFSPGCSCSSPHHGSSSTDFRPRSAAPPHRMCYYNRSWTSSTRTSPPAARAHPQRPRAAVRGPPWRSRRQRRHTT